MNYQETGNDVQKAMHAELLIMVLEHLLQLMLFNFRLKNVVYEKWRSNWYCVLSLYLSFFFRFHSLFAFAALMGEGKSARVLVYGL